MPTGQRLRVTPRSGRRARGGVASMTAPMGSGQLSNRRRTLRHSPSCARPPTRAPAPASAPARPPNRPCAAPAPRCRRARHAPNSRGWQRRQVARAFGHADPVDEALIDRRVAAGMGPRHRGHASVRADVRAQAPAAEVRRPGHPDDPAARYQGRPATCPGRRSDAWRRACRPAPAPRPAIPDPPARSRHSATASRPPHRGRRRAALVDPGSCPRRASARAVANPATPPPRIAISMLAISHTDALLRKSRHARLRHL